ncbi:MAG: preprotein translocase subunit SecA [Chloroflexi bacterium CG_4_10_14_0_8_um_filter_46_9]|nr:MAG: preprotein translocase subunit SecA [Chloroflexi bacterium CG_4_10_14_0_8_um_filter_46_9]
MLGWLTKLIDSNEKELNRLQPLVDRTNSFESDFEKLTDAELRAKTDEFKARLKDGEGLDKLLPEAYAAVREAAKRTIKQRHFDVQLMGGIVLHQGKIAEMATGEGKTLVATLPLYLNALTGEGCHLVTVNDYLAKRDCNWMGPIYHALGVSVACINAMQSPDQPSPSFLYDPDFDSEDPKWKHLRPITRRQAYEADITYGTNNEFGFDYLRDNMVLDLSQCVQRELNYAIVDEVDSILIDEARTPLIISGAAEEATKKYYTFAQLVSRLKKDEDYTVDERTRACSLTENGTTRMEQMLRNAGLLKAPSFYDPSNYFLTRYLENALKAYVLFRRDKDYMVKDGQVIIVDEFTGRLMFGRRYSEGLHQAIEAKEGVKIQRESITLATITFQNYFRLYQKLAGMTGTAATEAEEFHKIYKLEVVVIPTNEPLIRTEHPDQIYKNEKAKFEAVAKEIEQWHKQERPVLIGTTSIEKSEHLSDLLTRKGVPHQVLNAKHHEKEAAIVAQAGRLEAVTVATNMAGRGVDIILGGNPEGRDEQEWLEEHNKVVELGGLHVIGTEHHEARRIDNQLRGRAGRQGDPGSSRFHASLEDEVVRRFGGERIGGLMHWAGLGEDKPIEHPMVSKAITNAQVQTEGYNFDIRKHLVEYDDVVNQHREVIYGERKKILSGADLKANIMSMITDEIQSLVDAHFDHAKAELDATGLREDISTIFPSPPDIASLSSLIAVSRTPEPFASCHSERSEESRSAQGKLHEGTAQQSQIDGKEITEKLTNYAVGLYEQKEKEIGSENMRLIERVVMLRVIDKLWMEHLTAMEDMRQGIGLRAVGQQDPLMVYKREGRALFDGLLASIQHDVARNIYRVNLVKKEPPRQKQAVIAGKKVGRNDPCPCGSGKKYKHCCGRGI